jgi:hypothetical protein
MAHKPLDLSMRQADTHVCAAFHEDFTAMRAEASASVPVLLELLSTMIAAAQRITWPLHVDVELSGTHASGMHAHPNGIFRQ